MNNKEKKKYFNLKSGSRSPYVFAYEVDKQSFLLNNTPRTLYKFRKFDKYTINMIKNNYVYLAKESRLDDPFDCLTFINSYFNYPSLELPPEIINNISDNISKFVPGILPKIVIRKIIKQSIKNRKIDVSLIIEEVFKHDGIDEKGKQRINNILDQLDMFPSDIKQNEKLEESLNYFLKEKEKFGICSLTTKRDNKIMWSLYGDMYKGYCIEYDIPMVDDVIYNIFPVIYKTKYETNMHKILFKTLNDNVEKHSTEGYRNNDILAAFIELLCTKDRDWSYQDEWRLIGDEGTKFNKFKIKAIYLGFDVSKKNENKILKASKKYGYIVYKMNEPSGSNEISYKLLN